MPRFHFNVFDGRNDVDEEGTDLPGLAEARQHAIRYAGDILGNDAQRDDMGRDWHMEVTDRDGLILFRLDFHVTEAPVLRRDTLRGH